MLIHGSMIAVCLDYFPFVLLDLGDANRTEADFHAMFASLRESHARARKDATRHVLIGVAPLAPNARERKVIAMGSNQVPVADRTLFVSSVVVVPNALFRGAMTAIGWLVPGLPPFECVETAAQAVPAAAALLRKHGIPFRGEDMARAAVWFTQPASRTRPEPRSTSI
jgi:hypothetical protein